MSTVIPHHIRDVFSYSQKYKNKILVLYVDDAILSSEAVYPLVRDIVYMVHSGIRIMILPEVRHTIIKHQQLETMHGNTLYQTRTPLSESDISAIQRASFDVVSQIITYFARHRQTAVIGNWTLARSYGVVNGIDYKHSGFVEKIDLVAVDTLLRDAIIPVFPAIGWSYTGRPYYLNPIEMATQASIMMRATKLIFILNKNAHAHFEKRVTHTIESQKLFDNATAKNNTIRRMTELQAKAMLPHNKNDLSFSHLVSHAIQTLEHGIDRVHVLNGSQDGSLLIEIFSNQGSGFMMYADKYEAIMPMQKEDAPDVLLIMKPLIEQDILKPRSIEMLIEEHADFVIYKTDGRIRGVAALHNLGKGIAEIAALATNSDEDSSGIGTTLVQYLLAKAKKLAYNKVFVFTLKTGDWFERLGFIKLQEKTGIPEKRLQEHLTSQRQSRVYYMETKKIVSDILV